MICKYRQNLEQSHNQTKKRPSEIFLKVSEGWRLPTLPLGIAVPSALTGLTSLFGMGRGGSPSLLPPFVFRFRTIDFSTGCLFQGTTPYMV